MGRTFSESFKKEAVEAYLGGLGKVETIKKYDVGWTLLRRWRDQYMEFGCFPDGRGKHSKGRPRKADTSQMTKEEYIKYLEMENAILKRLRSLNNKRAK